MSVTRRFVIAALSMLCFTSMASAEPSNSPSTTQSPTAIICLGGRVDDFRRDTLFRQFREAEAAGAQTVILEIDTNGGVVISALDITRFLRRQTVHTIALVNNKAISAGSMIALACDEIVMTPGSVLGDCAPIKLENGRLVPLPAAERAKEESPILLDFSESATRNHYDPLLARAMVKVDVGVYLVKDASGHERVVDQDQFKALTATGDWKTPADVTNPIDSPDTLLIVGADMAKRLGFSKGTVNSARELAAQRGYTIVIDLSPGLGDHLVELLNTTGARFVLIVVFLLSLYITLHAPGHGAAEAVAIICLGLLVGMPMLAGYAQWWQLALILLGLALCAFELLVFPGHGVSLILGVLMVLLGLLLTFARENVGPGLFLHPPEIGTWLKHGLKVVVSAGVAAVLAGSMLRPILFRLLFSRQSVRTETDGQPVSAAGHKLRAEDDIWPFVGTVGLAQTDLRPGGIVQFPYGADVRNIDVVCASGFVSAGAKVIVQEARGIRVTVRRT